MSENKFLESKSLHFKNLFPIEILRLINEFSGEQKLDYYLKREMKSKFVNKYGFDRLYKMGYRDFSDIDVPGKLIKDICLWKCKFQNSNMSRCKFINTELTCCIFRDTNLNNCYIHNCTFMNSMFINSDMNKIVMINCHAFDAIFSCVRLSKSIINNSRFEGAMFPGSRLVGTKCTNCIFDDLIGCNTTGTIFIND